MTEQHPQIAVVAEAFIDRSLDEMLDWLAVSAPDVTGLELGSGGYAPHPHCDTAELLADVAFRRRWAHAINDRGFDVVALNAWGNPLHPDPGVAETHDRALRETIRLAAELGISRVIALAGCPPARDGDATPYFAAGGWLPYLEGIYEEQWVRSVGPYWQELSDFARREHPDLLICVELHPGTAVYNVDTFWRLAALGDNLAANIDPSHFFWQHMDALAVMAQLAPRVGHMHAKDVTFNERVLASAGLLDHRWPAATADVAWKFATVGAGHDQEWWTRLFALCEDSQVTAIAIEHEDPDVPVEVGVPDSAKLIKSALEVTV